MLDRLMAASRGLLPWAAGLALLVLALLAFRSISDREVRARRAMADELQERLQESVGAFEADLLTELDGLLARASANPAEADAIEQRARRQHTWFDALYVWRIRTEGALVEVAFDHPQTRLPSASVDMSCVLGVREASLDPATLGTEDLASLLMSACADQPLPVRAYASTEAAQLLREAGRPHDALAALAVPDLDDLLPLTTTPEVDVTRRVTRRLLRADLLDEIGDAATARRLRDATLVEVADLPAPVLDAALFLVPGVVEKMGSVPRTRIDALLARAEQRLAAWREIRQNALRAGAAQVSEDARFTYDQYSDTPYLLYSRRTPEGGVALQLRQEALLSAWLSQGGRLLEEVVIQDLSGRRVAGASGQPSDVVVPFAQTLRHLRVGLTQQGVAERADAASVWHQAPIAGIVAICIILGLGAIWMQQRANARYHQLLDRQRDFTARVTHELKTPLAGIRVMAENLSIGAYKSEAQREHMAERIIQEADRLTVRVNEVLQSSAKREIPEPTPFDLEEVLLELLDSWAPRYEQAGIELLADIAATDPIVGDGGALRDAVACLLDNALKYRREDVDSRVWLNVTQEGRDVEIEVLDNGLGVPEGLRRSVFERFVRVEGPNRGMAGGHGLGLAQVATIVAEHGGTVRCEEGVEGGARFVIRLRTTPGAVVP